MMTTHRDLAEIVAALYGEDGAPSVAWSYRAPDDAPVMFAVVRLDPYVLVASLGTRSALDLVRDVVALAREPVDHPEFGKVHAGFYDGITVAWEILSPMIERDEKLIFLGHSLGAVHAEFLAAHVVVQMKRVPFIGRWAAPKAGFVKFADVLAGTPGFSYDNYDATGFDPIVELPITTAQYPYVHACAPTQVTQRPSPKLILDLGPQIAWHFFTNYRAATPATPVEF